MDDDKASLPSLLSHEELIQRPPREYNSSTLQFSGGGGGVCVRECD